MMALADRDRVVNRQGARLAEEELDALCMFSRNAISTQGQTRRMGIIVIINC